MKFKMSLVAAAAVISCNLAHAQFVEGSTSSTQTTVGTGAASQINGTAVGALANAGAQSVAVGGNANANAQGAVAVGGCINVVCLENGVIVNRPLPVGTGSTAVGGGSMTSGDHSTALGASANASNANSVALGAGSRTTRDNTVEVGGRQITGVAAGAAGTDAVNVDQLNSGLGSTLNQANAYTDSKVGQAVSQANAYTDSKVSQAVSQANSYTQTVAGQTLNSANSYTNIVAGQTLNTANNYTDEKTKYFASNGFGGAAADASGIRATAMGPDSVASGSNSLAAGTDAKASADGALAMGSHANATAVYATSVGAASIASGAGSSAFGHGSKALGESSTAFGQSSIATNNGDVALGAYSVTGATIATKSATLIGVDYSFAGNTPSSTVSVGDVGKERTISNVAAGRLSATSTDAVNGSQLHATNTALNALGDNVGNLGTSTAANLGAGSVYDSKTGSVSAPSYVINGVTYNNVGGAFNALGSTIASNNTNNLPPAASTGNNSVAIGPGSVSDRDNTISFGTIGAERQLTNVAPGTAATDAANLGQVRTLVEKSAGDSKAYTDDRVNALNAKLQKQIAGVGAMAMAASALVPNARAEGPTSISAAVGTYSGETAVAAGVNYYVSNNVLINAKVSVSTSGSAKAGAAVGVTWGF
jgi:trimeric autotransporter adhesin